MLKVNARYVDTPHPRVFGGVDFFDDSEDAVHGRDYSSWLCRSFVVSFFEAFTESLILAQDERWRRA